MSADVAMQYGARTFFVYSFFSDFRKEFYADNLQTSCSWDVHFKISDRLLRSHEIFKCGVKDVMLLCGYFRMRFNNRQKGFATTRNAKWKKSGKWDYASKNDDYGLSLSMYHRILEYSEFESLRQAGIQ